MRRLLVSLVLLVALLASPALAYPPDRWDIVTTIRPQPALLSRYRIDAAGTPNYRLMAYRPRQMVATWNWTDASWGARTLTEASRYAGWDVIAPNNQGVYRVTASDAFFRLTLTRAATVAVVWRGGATIPPWLSGWTADGTLHEDHFAGRDNPVYRMVLPAGANDLGGVYGAGQTVGDPRDVYLVLLAEADGTPSVAPPVGTGLTVPATNTPCPTWLHDRWITPGPDGQDYPTWHPEIDPVYWCYYGHDHGSDPGESLLPAYGYSAGGAEPHVGFKTYVFTDRDPNGPNTWTVTNHQGTAGKARVCARFHTLDILIRDETGAVVIDYHFMADFGASRDNDNVVYTPVDCPDQAQDAAGSNGTRVVPRVGGIGYEPWRADANPTLGIASTFTPNTRDQVTRCNDLTCSAVVNAFNDSDGTANSGTSRFVTLTSTYLIQPPQTGSFCTDAMATTVVDCAVPGALAQDASGVVIDPVLFNAANTFGCYAPDGWGDPYVCADQVLDTPTEREDSVPTGGPN